MGKGNVRKGLGMSFQLIGLFFLIGGLMNSGDWLMAGFGLGFIVVGFALYADENLSALKYLQDWLGCLFVLMAYTSVILFFLMFQGDIEFPVSLIAFVFSGWLSYALFKLLKRVNKKYAASEKAATSENQATVIAKTFADKQRERDESAGKVNAAAMQTTPTKAPAQKQEESTEAQIAALAAKLNEAPNSPTIQEKRRAPAMSQEEFYGFIDAEAAGLPPDEAACYTSEGQALLLKTAIRVLPQMEMLCAPGFPGDRLLHAADGAQAYDAMLDLVDSIHDLLKSFSRSQLQETLSGVSQEDALLTWKAFRFYAETMGSEDGFEEIFCLLSDRV